MHRVVETLALSMSGSPPLKRALYAALAAGLPSGLKKKLVALGYHVAREAFDRFAHDYAFAPNMAFSLEKLRARGLGATTIIDVGAFRGDWSRMARQIWPNARLHMVEANAAQEAELRQVAQTIGADVHVVLLGPEDGKDATFFVMGTGSSVFEEDSPLDRTAITLPLHRLDTLIDVAAVDILKLDVQGFELEVLRGAPRLLSSAQVVLLEVSLIPVNKGAPLFADVVGFMSERGFVVADIVGLHRRPLDGATNQVDLLFVPRGSALIADTRHFA